MLVNCGMVVGSLALSLFLVDSARVHVQTVPVNPCDANAASCECFAFRDVNFCNSCSIDCGPCRAFCWAIVKAPEGKKRDNWNNPDNWQGGKVPIGDMGAIVANGLNVTVDSDATPVYSGELKLQANSRLRIAWASGNKGAARAVSGASRIVMESGSALNSNLKHNIDFPPITLEGDAQVEMPSTGSHGSSFSFKAIDGAHKFSLVSCHRCNYDFTAASTFSEFMMNVGGTSELHAKAPGCFGIGDVSLSLVSRHVLKLFLDDSNAIASSATLYLTSKSSSGQGKIEIGLAAGVTQVLTGLLVDGFRVAEGIYRADRQIFGDDSVTLVGDGELEVRG